MKLIYVLWNDLLHVLEVCFVFFIVLRKYIEWNLRQRMSSHNCAIKALLLHMVTRFIGKIASNQVTHITNVLTAHHRLESRLWTQISCKSKKQKIVRKSIHRIKANRWAWTHTHIKTNFHNLVRFNCLHCSSIAKALPPSSIIIVAMQRCVN